MYLFEYARRLLGEELRVEGLVVADQPEQVVLITALERTLAWNIKYNDVNVTKKIYVIKIIQAVTTNKKISLLIDLLNILYCTIT